MSTVASYRCSAISANAFHCQKRYDRARWTAVLPQQGCLNHRRTTSWSGQASWCRPCCTGVLPTTSFYYRNYRSISSDIHLPEVTTRLNDTHGATLGDAFSPLLATRTCHADIFSSGLFRWNDSVLFLRPRAGDRSKSASVVVKARRKQL